MDKAIACSNKVSRRKERRSYNGKAQWQRGSLWEHSIWNETRGRSWTSHVSTLSSAHVSNSCGHRKFLWAKRSCTDCFILWQLRQWHPTPVLLPGKSHGRRTLVGCSPWGHEESDTTERLHFLFSLSCIGEGNGNPLQCSCLENPRDGGAWWATIYGVAQSRTRLTWLSSN